MSLLKQMEESRLTLEEIQELVTLLTDVLPKIEVRAKKDRNMSALAKNLQSGLSKIKGFNIEDIKIPENDYATGYERLKSAKDKLVKFTEVIKEII